MSTTTLTRPEPLYRRTASTSDQGASFTRVRVISARQHINHEFFEEPKTTNQLLSSALLQATSVVREGTRDLGLERASALVDRIAELLESEEWEGDGEMLKVGSVRTLVRTIVALDAEVGGVALTRSGNLAISWHTGDRKLRVEAHPDGKVSWALIRRSGDTIDARHQAVDTIANLRSVCKA